MLDVILGNPILLALAALVGMAIAFGALLGFAAVRFEVEGNPLSDQINAILPQTQCGQCGYPGCRPYAEAIADGDSINKCPPGGEDTIQALANLLDVEPEPLDAEHGVEALGFNGDSEEGQEGSHHPQLSQNVVGERRDRGGLGVSKSKGRAER